VQVTASCRVARLSRPRGRRRTHPPSRQSQPTTRGFETHERTSHLRLVHRSARRSSVRTWSNVLGSSKRSCNHHHMRHGRVVLSAETTSVFSSLKVAPPGFSPVRFGFDRVVCHTNAFSAVSSPLRPSLRTKDSPHRDTEVSEPVRPASSTPSHLRRSVGGRPPPPPRAVRDYTGIVVWFWGVRNVVLKGLLSLFFLANSSRYNALCRESRFVGFRERRTHKKTILD